MLFEIPCIQSLINDYVCGPKIHWYRPYQKVLKEIEQVQQHDTRYYIGIEHSWLMSPMEILPSELDWSFNCNSVVTSLRRSVSRLIVEEIANI